MTDEQILKFCTLAHLEISKDNKEVVNYNFGRFDALSKLEQVLTDAGKFDETQVTDILKMLRQVAAIAVEVDNDYSKEHPSPNLRDEVYKAAFNSSNQDATIVLDVVPDMEGNTKANLAEFEKLTADNQQPNNGLSTYEVI
jgi:Asp-tRNA(Asn)/Glu-tRNA(Gln) amidotransferase C subunit